MTTWVAERSGRVPVAGEGPRCAGCDLRALLDACPVAVIELDPAGVVREWNPAASQLFGRPAADVVGGALPSGMFGERLDLVRLIADMDAGLPSPVRRLRCRRADGQMVDMELSAAVTRTTDNEVRGLMALLVDVSERERLERKLRHQAEHDSLTELPNRELLQSQTAAALAAAGAAGTTTGVLLFDLDKFKEVNDTLGHECGDQLLVQVGPRLLADALRGEDVVARLSGDEFAVLLPDVGGVAGAVEIAERVLSALNVPFPVGETSADVTASIGVAVAPEHGTNPVDLLRHADTAMYEAKDAATGVAVYEAERTVHRPTRFGLLGQLRRALDRDELVVYYQPKLDLVEGTLAGAEALVRWQHPERGLLSPDDFIPVAETTGLIHRLTARVLDIALGQARAWSRAGFDVPVAVNLSARSLHDRQLPGRVAAALARHEVPAELLCLEITESSIMRDPDAALVVLQELDEAGVQLSLDDFGTGYSSMTYLRQLPVGELKVDRSFVQDLASQAADAVLVRSVIDLGHNLGLSVVAEGVEDASTLRALHGLGCDVAQGFYFAHPMPAGRFDAWLQRSRR